MKRYRKHGRAPRWVRLGWFERTVIGAVVVVGMILFAVLLYSATSAFAG